jgi:hypothetical protein
MILSYLCRHFVAVKRAEWFAKQDSNEFPYKTIYERNCNLLSIMKSNVNKKHSPNHPFQTKVIKTKSVLSRSMLFLTMQQWKRRVFTFLFLLILLFLVFLRLFFVLPLFIFPLLLLLFVKFLLYLSPSSSLSSFLPACSFLFSCSSFPSFCLLILFYFLPVSLLLPHLLPVLRHLLPVLILVLNLLLPSSNAPYFNLSTNAS